MVEGYSNGIRYSLLMVNTIILMIGLLVLTIGIWAVSDRSLMERLLGINVYIASAVLLIITGTIVSLIALLGTLGAYKETKSMLKGYFVILLLLLTLIMAAAGLGYSLKDQLEERVQLELAASQKLYGIDYHVTEAWDSIQSTFECCGVANKTSRGFESWRRESNRFAGSIDGPLLPESCCRSREDDQVKRACQGPRPRKEDTYLEGCFEKIKQAIKQHSLTIGLTSSSALVFIVVGLILSGALYYAIGRHKALQETIVEP